MNNIGGIGQSYRPPTQGWTSGSSILYSPFFIGTATQSWLQQAAINNNVIQPQGVIPTTGSPYTRIVDAVCGDYMVCDGFDTYHWCCNDTGSMVNNGCPHGTWIGCNPISNYNVTFPFTPIYPTASLVSKSLCDTYYGYKNLQSKKSWHGIPSLIDVDTNNCPNVASICSGTEVDYRDYQSSPAQILYRGANWDLSYDYYEEAYILTGSMPCDDVNTTPWSIKTTIPTKQGYCNITRNVSANRYTGEITQGQNIRERIQTYANIDPSSPWVIYDNCGGIYSTITGSRWWDNEIITGSCNYKVYDFPDGSYDIYNNPQPYKTVEDIGSPGLILQPDMVTIPNCSSNLQTFVNLINIWNTLTHGDHYKQPTGSGIIIPTVAVSGFSGTDSYSMGWPDNGMAGTCSVGLHSGSIFNVIDVSPYSSTCDVSVMRNDTSYVFSIAIDAYLGDGSATTITHYIYDYNGSVNLTDAYTSTDVQNDLDTLLSKWDMVDNNIYPPRIDGYGNIAPLLTYNELPPVNPINYGYQCLIDDLRSPINDINGNSPFTLLSSAGQKGPPIDDGSGYPPFAPCWTPTYDTPAAWIPTWNQTPWFDSNIKCFYWTGTGSVDITPATGTASLYDGSILGKPSIITASISSSFTVRTGNWDYRHPVWDYNGCAASIPPTPPYWYIKGYGELNSGQFGLPLTATQWTDYHDTSLFPPYACSFNIGPTCYKQKWAEIKEVFPSWDFNKPYGQDRYTIDQTACSCYTDYTTTIGDAIVYAFNDGYTIDYLNPITPFAINDICGGTDLNGFYTITAVSGDGVSSPYSLTTGSLVLPLPSGFTETFCRLKYPSCPAFGTTPINVSFNGTGSIITFITSNVQYSGSTLVDFYQAVRNPQGQLVPAQSPLNTSSINIHYADEYHASCSGDFRLANYLISTGSKTWWCDTQPKGQVVTYQWLHDNRTNNEIGRLSIINDCNGNPVPTGSNPNFGYSQFNATQVSLVSASIDGIPTKNCPTDCSNVGWICFSPNNEYFNNKSRTYPMPSHSYDFVYNSMWQSEIVQCINTLDWQLPHKICGTDPYYVTLKVDDGTCQPEDDSNSPFITQYYGYPQQIEPFLTLPTTRLLNGAMDIAPNPYSSSGHFKWTIDNPVTTASGVTAPYNAGFSGGGTSKESFFPWNLKTNVCSNITCSLYDYQWVQC